MKIQKKKKNHITCIIQYFKTVVCFIHKCKLCLFKALDSTTKKPLVMREADLGSGATYCLLMFLAAILRSAVGTLRVRVDHLAHPVKDGPPHYRDRYMHKLLYMTCNKSIL